MVGIKMNDRGGRKATSLHENQEEKMLKIGFIGWRGMVGSVLMQRMREEGDFKVPSS